MSLPLATSLTPGKEGVERTEVDREEEEHEDGDEPERLQGELLVLI